MLLWSPHEGPDAASRVTQSESPVLRATPLGRYAQDMISSAVVFLGLAAMLSGGCFDPPAEYGPVQADVITSEETDFEAMWDTVLRVLQRYDFRPDRQDRREGVITTLPITSRQWFEFWRDDAIGLYQMTEASLHTIQRQAVIKIRRRPEPGRYRVIVRVDVFRYSVPERQVTTPSGALAMFDAKMPSEQGDLPGRGEAAHWVRVGRDPEMEGMLLRRILSHYPGSYELIEEPEETIEDIMGRQEQPTSLPGTIPAAK